MVCRACCRGRKGSDRSPRVGKATLARVRRERMGHIELAVPVSHIWFFKGTPSRLGLVLDVTARNHERVIYYADSLVLDPGSTPLALHQPLTANE